LAGRHGGRGERDRRRSATLHHVAAAGIGVAHVGHVSPPMDPGWTLAGLHYNGLTAGRHDQRCPERDPEKREPVFRKDHAIAKLRSSNAREARMIGRTRWAANGSFAS